MNPVGSPPTSPLLHATNAMVLYFLVLRILTVPLPWSIERGRALTAAAGFAALLFAIHPLRLESVAWVTERRDVLSAPFYLLAILVDPRGQQREELACCWQWLLVTLF